MKTIFCHGEAQEFPSDQFGKDDDGNLIHNVGRKHYAATGEYVKPVTVPGTKARRRIPRAYDKMK